MGLAAFNRMRREQAEREAAERAKLEQETQEVVIAPEDEKGPGESEIESLTLEEVKERLEKLEIKFAHNTSEAKLREKLKNAIN